MAQLLERSDSNIVLLCSFHYRTNKELVTEVYFFDDNWKQRDQKPQKRRYKMRLVSVRDVSRTHARTHERITEILRYDLILKCRSRACCVAHVRMTDGEKALKRPVLISVAVLNTLH